MGTVLRFDMRCDDRVRAAKRQERYISRPLENGETPWFDSNASARRLSHHINRRFFREKKNGMIVEALEERLADIAEEAQIILALLSIISTRRHPYWMYR
jgi:hypothetical protein